MRILARVRVRAKVRDMAKSRMHMSCLEDDEDAGDGGCDRGSD